MNAIEALQELADERGVSQETEELKPENIYGHALRVLLAYAPEDSESKEAVDKLFPKPNGREKIEYIKNTPTTIHEVDSNLSASITLFNKLRYVSPTSEPTGGYLELVVGFFKGTTAIRDVTFEVSGTQALDFRTGRDANLRQRRQISALLSGHETALTRARHYTSQPQTPAAFSYLPGLRH